MPTEPTYTGVVVLVDGVTLQFSAEDAVAAFGSDPSLAVAVGDTLQIEMRAEVA